MDEKDLFLDNFKNEYFKIIRVNGINLKEGDIIQFQPNVDTENKKFMHAIQV